MSTSLRSRQVTLDSLSTPLFPSSPTSRIPTADFRSFAVPPTPEFSPTVANNPYQSFAVNQTAAQPEHESTADAVGQTEAQYEFEPEEHVKSKTIVLCFDGTGNKFGQV